VIKGCIRKWNLECAAMDDFRFRIDFSAPDERLIAEIDADHTRSTVNQSPADFANA